MNSKEGGTGKKSGVLLGALAALGFSGDSDPGLKSKPGLEDSLDGTKTAIMWVVDVRESDPHGILDSLKNSCPELAAANQDAALLEVIEALGNDLLDFLNNFGPLSLLMLALVYIKRKKSVDTISLDDHPDVKTKLEPQLAEARVLTVELDAAVDKPIGAAQSEILCARVAAVTSGILLTLAPLTAEASISDLWDGAKGTYEGATRGLGGLLQTIGRIAEALSYLSYVVDLAILAGIIGLGFKNANAIGKAWRGITNNRIRARRAGDLVVGPRIISTPIAVRGHVLRAGNTHEGGIATRLMARPGTAPGDIAAQTAGRALHAAVTGPTTTTTRSIISRLMSGEIAVGNFRAETREIGRIADEILATLGVDYTKPANVFPAAAFDANVDRFNTLVSGLNARLHNIPQNEREFNFRDIAAMIMLVSSLVLGYGWYKAHYSGVNSGSGSPRVSVPVSSPPDGAPSNWPSTTPTAPVGAPGGGSDRSFGVLPDSVPTLAPSEPPSGTPSQPAQQPPTPGKPPVVPDKSRIPSVDYDI